MKRMVTLLLLFIASPASGWGEEIILQPGNCVMIPRYFKICAAPALPTPAPQNNCVCKYGIRQTEDGQPGKGFWLVREDDKTIKNFLADEEACYKASKEIAACSQ